MDTLKGALGVILCITAGVAVADPDADVRKVLEQVNSGFARYDAHQVASAYTETATWQNPFGVRLEGRQQIEKFLTRLFQKPGFRSGQSTSSAKLTGLNFRSPDVAVAWSEETSEGQVDDQTGKPIGLRKSHYLDVLVRSREGWLISDEMIMDEK